MMLVMEAVGRATPDVTSGTVVMIGVGVMRLNEVFARVAVVTMSVVEVTVVVESVRGCRSQLLASVKWRRNGSPLV